MSWLGNLVRRARLRGLVDGKVQTVRAESLENLAHDKAERHQDYGFAGNPVDGQGLVMHLDGDTLVIRLDRLAERPGLAPLEVAVWHSEGHMVKLKAGRVVEVTCDSLIVNASADVTINTPVMTVNASDQVTLATPLVSATTDLDVGGDAHIAGSATADVDVASGPITLRTHKTSQVKTGSDTSGPPVAP